MTAEDPPAGLAADRGANQEEYRTACGIWIKEKERTRSVGQRRGQQRCRQASRYTVETLNR